MSTLTIRLPDDKHERQRALARFNWISINKLMDELATVALANHDAGVAVPRAAVSLHRLDATRLRTSDRDRSARGVRQADRAASRHFHSRHRCMLGIQDNCQVAGRGRDGDLSPPPPPRSVRAALPHTAPAASHDAKR
jgi:hypothetical protein